MAGFIACARLHLILAIYKLCIKCSKIKLILTLVVIII